MGTGIYRPFELILNSADSLAVIAVNSPHNEFTNQKWLTAWNKAKIRLCTDGAANRIVDFCRINRIKDPELIVGDFDSITEETKRFFVERSSCKLYHMNDQDSTDLTKTLNALMNEGITGFKADDHLQGVLLLGGLAGRFDHVLGTLNAMLLQIQSKPKMFVFALDGQNMLTILPKGENTIQLAPEHVTGVCGLLPIVQRRTVVSTEGFQWELNGTELEYGHLVSTSNMIVRPLLTVKCNEPVVFTFELKLADAPV